MPDRILVVDNDDGTRHSAMLALLPAGYEMSIAEDPFAAMQVALQVRPNLIVLADSMIDSDGLALIGRLFSAPQTASIPVVVIANTTERQVAADRAGAGAVLLGPANTAEFLGFVARHAHTVGGLSGAPKSLLEDLDRLAAVEALLPGPDGDPDLDRFTELAAKMLGVQASVITLIDKDRQIFASQTGVASAGTSLGETSLDKSFCQFAVTSRAPLRIDDATTHPLVSTNPAIDTLNMRSYVGIPLIVGGGQAVGTLCAIDSEPRHWSDDDVDKLDGLAQILTAHLDSAMTGRGRHSAK